MALTISYVLMALLTPDIYSPLPSRPGDAIRVTDSTLSPLPVLTFFLKKKKKTDLFICPCLVLVWASRIKLRPLVLEAQSLSHWTIRQIPSFSDFFSSWWHYACMCAKSLQSCLTLWDPMDCSPPDSSVHGVLQARILEWVAIPSSRGSSQPRDRSCVSSVSWIGRWILYH